MGEDLPPRFQINDTPNVIFQGDGLVLHLAVAVDQADLLPLVDKVEKELLLRDHSHVDPVLVGEVGGNVQLKTLSVPKRRYFVNLGVFVEYLILGGHPYMTSAHFFDSLSPSIYKSYAMFISKILRS